MTATQPTGGASSGWLGLGFTQGNTASNTSFATATINAAPWLLWRPIIATDASQVVTRLGPAVSADNVNEGAFTGTQTLTIVLNTQALAWTAEWFVGTTSVRGPEAFATNPTIANVGFARENGHGSTITSFSLTSGVPEVLSLVKANNSDNLDLGSSWVGGVVPTSAASAKWDSTVTAANTTSLGADLTFGSIVIADPAGPVTIDPGIDPGNTLTLGAGLVDIDLVAATQDLTLNCSLALDAANEWNVASGRTLALGGVVSGSAGVTKLGLGTAILSNANTYSGDTTVYAGTLVANNNAALGTGLLELNGGNLSNTASCTLGNGVYLSANAAVNVDASQTLTLNGSIASTGSLTKTGTGMLTLSGTNTHTGATNVSAGTLTLSGSRTATATGGFFVGNQASSTGTLNVTNGNFTVGTTGSNFQVGSATGAVGIMNQSGGTLTTTGNQLLIGALGGTGTYNLSAGQINTIAGALGVVLGVNSDTTGNFILSGTGILNMAAASTLQIGRSQGLSTPATNTTGLFNQTAGTATVGILAMGGISTDPADTAGANATLTLTGGTFSAVAFSALSGGNNSVSTINIGGTAVVTLPNFPTGRGPLGATATLNFDGGTLLNSATGTFITGLTNAFIEDGGAQFDTSLNSTTVSQNLLTHGSSLGGGLTKIGANTLTLGGANTYTGATLVSEGTLALVGGSQESAITVANGATLGFNIAFPTSSTQSVTLNAGHKISVSPPPTLSSYTLLTTTATITGATPNLDPAIPGYAVILDGGNTLKLVATATNTFASWISTFGLTPADKDLGDDPDGDGSDNGVENFFGTNPGVFSSGLVAVSASGGIFTFTHPQNATPASDLTASYTWSKDLATFLANGATDGALTKVDFTTQANTPSPGITTVTATVTGTATSKLFVRVNVTQP